MRKGRPSGRPFSFRRTRRIHSVLDSRHDSRIPGRSAVDELNAPLGQGPAPKKRLPLARLASQGVAGLLGLALAVVVLWASLLRIHDGGERPVQALPAPVQQAEAPAPPPPQPEPQVATAPPPGTQTVNIIDGMTGKRQEIIIGTPAAKRPAGDPRLLEATRYGPIPKVGKDGVRPADVYARKPSVSDTPAPNAVRIAIVVGGLGAGATATANALAKLPGAVSLAFTPYGSDLETQTAQARDKGHEILLQVPMEPGDYPDNDPGPQTLLTSLSAEQNVDRLHWLFSRFQGYVGVVNVMGAGFTSSEKALAPVLGDVAKRGLIYVDDGLSPHSQAGQIASVNKLPYAKADVAIDAVPSATEIDNALKRLETIARSGAVAVGYSSALPASIDRIAKWAKAAQARGIVLVPVTAATVRARSS